MYQINKQNEDLLERIRTKLENSLSEAHVSGTLVGAEAEAGELGAENPVNVDDALSMYLDTILERLVQEIGMGEDEAVDFIYAMADELSSEGDLPPFPDEDAMADAVSMWIGKATTLGFEHYVLLAAYQG